MSNALEHPRVELADVRALGPAYDRPIALGWNDLSDWRESPASKRAGRRFVLRNLVPGGLYVDAGFDAEHPPPASLPEMDWVAEDRGVVVWRRRGEAMPQPAGTPDRAWWQWLDRMLQLAPQPYLLREAWLTGARAPGEDPTMMASPSSRAAVWASGARELDGRLQWRASARVVGGASEALGQVLFAEAGAPPVRLRVVGVDGAAISCAMAGDEVLIIPRRCSVDRSASDRVGLDRLECLYFEHHPPGPWVSLAHFKAAR
ncbi:MAG TPA: hypothetical protein ENK57_01610 [Polyangiaceae bacterium]|nr:hypothetical protein [Polyangiaceae bacterium]